MSHAWVVGSIFAVGLAVCPPLSAQERTSWPADRDIAALAYSPDGATLASVGRDAIRLWDAQGRESGSWPNGAFSGCFTSGGKELVLATAHGVLVRDLPTGTDRALTSAWTSLVEPGPGGTLVAVAERKTVRVLDTGTGAERAVFELNDGGILALAFSPDGMLLAGGNRDKRIHLWDLSTRTERATFASSGQDRVTAVAFSPDGRSLYAATNAIERWDVAAGRCADVIKPADFRSASSLRRSPDGKFLATAVGSSILLLDSESGRLLGELNSGGGAILALAFSPDGATLASSDEDRYIRLWDTSLTR